MTDQEIKIRITSDVNQVLSDTQKVEQAFNLLAKKVNQAFGDAVIKQNQFGEELKKNLGLFSKSINLTGPIENLKSLDQGLKTFNLTQSEFNSFLTKQGYALMETGQIMDKLTGKVVRQDFALRGAAKSARGFKAEWLSVMFAGMALQRAFGGIISAQMQLFGITDMLSSMWTIIMLPVMELIAPIIYKIIEAFMNLDPGIQTAIGVFVLLMAVIGTIATVVGTVILAIGGIATALGVSFAAVASLIAPVIVVIAGIGLIVGGVMDIVKGKFEGIGLVIMGVGAVLLLFIGWWALIPIAVGAAVYWVIKHWETVKGWFAAFGNWLIDLWNKFPDGVKSAFKIVANFVIGLINSSITGFEWMVNMAIKGLNQLIKLANKIPGVRIGTIGEISLPRIPSFKTGGLMPNDGLAYLHAGEVVVPKNQVRNGVGMGGQIVFSPTVSVNANVSSSYDVRQLANELNKYWAADMQRIIKNRGSM